MRSPVRVLVLVEVADEGEVPLEIAGKVAESDAVEQVVRSVRRPHDQTFGVDVEPLGGYTRGDPRLYARLFRALQTVDVLHVHPNAVGAIARALAYVTDVPIIKTEHNTHDSYGAVKNALNGVMNTVSDVVAPVSEAVAESFREWERGLIMFGGGRITVVHNGVDMAKIDAAATQSPPIALPSGFLVGCGGYHDEQKNLSSVIEAIAEAASRIPALQLIITGDGPKRPELEQLVADRGIDDRVTFTGYLEEREDVHALYHRLDAFAFPSRYEGFGVAVAEAMAAAVPVIASDLPVLREVVGEAGIYVDPAATDEFAGALTRLHDDEQYRHRLGQSGHRRVTERFRLDQTADAYVDLYQEVSAERA